MVHGPTSPRRGRAVEAGTPAGPPIADRFEAVLDAYRPSRRDLLKFTAAMTALGFVQETNAPGRLLSWLQEEAAEARTNNLTATLLRADDFLELRFEFFNLKLLGPGQAGPGDVEAARLVRKDPAAAAYVVVHFQPQTVGEQTFWESSDTDDSNDSEVSKPAEEQNTSDPLPSLPVKARIAGPTRLAFKVRDAVEAIPFNDESLLGWVNFDQRVVPAALPPVSGRLKSPPSLRAPLANETQIEYPWRLYISPHSGAGWAHATAPVTYDGRTELWHTRLGVRKELDGKRFVDEDDDDLRTIRAVWTPGFDRNDAPAASSVGPFRMPLTPRDRWELIKLTSDFKILKYSPQPVKARRFMLSTYGAWMDSRGDWAPPGSLNVLHWTQRGTMGREHYVRVVKRGYLFPFGHRAALIQISERKFKPITQGPQAGQIAAFLFKRAFIVVKEPEKSYGTRDMPFKNVRIRTALTPNLDPYDVNNATNVKKQNGQKYGEEAFWPRVGNKDFLFGCVATDEDGQTVEFSTPLIFVLHSVATQTGEMDNVCNRYEAAANAARRNRPLEGQPVAYAPSTDGKPGDTSVETVNFMLGCKHKNSGTPRFRPRMMEAEVRLSAVEAVKGPLGTATVLHHPVYLTKGIDHADNKTQSFLKLKNPVTLDYGSGGNGDRCGGIGAPNMDISGVSRTLGPTGGADPDAVPPEFNPADFLQGAKFLGIDFVDVLKVGLSFLTDAAKIPKTVSETIFEDGDPTKPKKEIRTSLDWKPDLKADPLEIFEPTGPDGPAKMELKALFVTPINPPGEPDFEVKGDLRSFKLNLFGKADAFLILHFNNVTIDARKGQKPEVDVDIQEVEFAGPLTFVNQLKELMKSSGNGFELDITPTQVSASYTVAFPTTTAGVFTLAHIAFTAGVTIPFTGDPVTARFAFCSREQPMLLTYTIFGGGAYFEINVGAHGIEGFKASLEFGAAASIDLGVASGSVSIMAGIYFEMDGDQAALTGYVRLNGDLDILGLIHVSLEFYLALTYDIDADEAWGQCTVTIEVEVLFFSASVSATAEKKFAGGGGGGGAPAASAPASTKALTSESEALGPDPISFEELMSQQQWESDYVPAFAPGAF